MITIKTETEFTVSLPSLQIEAYDTRAQIILAATELHRFIVYGGSEQAVEIAERWLRDELFEKRLPVRYPKQRELLVWANAEDRD